MFLYNNILLSNAKVNFLFLFPVHLIRQFIYPCIMEISNNFLMLNERNFSLEIFLFFLIGSDKKKFALLFWKEYISAESPG